MGKPRARACAGVPRTGGRKDLSTRGDAGAYLGWRVAGGQDFAHFVNCAAWSKWGRWGALEWVSQPREESPKYDALQRFIETNPRWW